MTNAVSQSTIIPEGYCQCGCGGKTKIAKQTDTKRGLIKGKPFRYLPGHNSRGTSNPRYNGGLTFDRKGNRWLVRCRDGSLVEYYRAVMECVLKRKLESHETVHHIDGDSTNDTPENLQLFSRPGEHTSIGHYGHTSIHLLLKIRHYFHVTDEFPTMRKIKACNWMPSPSVFQLRFGSWNNALREAGLL